MSIDDDIRAFGQLQAALARPFADRDTVLRAAGADERALRAAQMQWARRFVDPNAGPLREAYRLAFSTPPRAIRYDGVDVDSTLPALVSAESALPFRAAPNGVVPEAVRALRGAGQTEPRTSSDGEETLWIPPPDEKEGDA